MLQIKNMSYRLLGETKEEDFELYNINFTLEQGFLMGLLGLNGSGKSTLMNLILGVYTPDKGSITLDGKQVSRETMQQIACVSDDAEFLRNRTLEENAKLFGELYEQYSKERMLAYLETFDISMWDWRDKCYGELSTGQKRKFQIAFALSYQPKFLLLDEPTANLDPHDRVELLELLQGLLAEEDIGVIMSTHLTRDLDRIADYICVLDKGEQRIYTDREKLVDQYGEIELSQLLLQL